MKLRGLPSPLSADMWDCAITSIRHGGRLFAKQGAEDGQMERAYSSL